MRTLRFYKQGYDGKTRWWADIKPWAFPKRMLIMYPSAEEWLEKIGEAKNEITIQFSTTAFDDAEELHRHKSEGPIKGTSYTATSYKGLPTDHKILLCPVTLYVFGRYPKTIYYQVV